MTLRSTRSPSAVYRGRRRDLQDPQNSTTATLQEGPRPLGDDSVSSELTSSIVWSSVVL